jgi:hypothetical protein
VSALRSLAFGVAVLATMLTLLVSNIGIWALSTLLDPPAVARTVTTALGDPEVRGYVSGRVGAQVASAVMDIGPLPAPVRRVLGLPARPSEATIAAALTERVDGLLANETTGEALGLAADAFEQLVADVLEDLDATDPAWTEHGLVVDLTPVGRLLLDRLDPSGGLSGALPVGSVTIQLASGEVLTAVVSLSRLFDALRWLLPLASLVAVVATLVLARYRVHALAWVGLCGVVAGTLSLLAASGVPVLASRLSTADTGQANAITAALDSVTASLVIQSAVLAGLGLALVVAGIAGGVVVAQGDTGRGARHGWDAGGLS